MSKILCIGLAKTSTTSLCEALEMLGFSALHFPHSLEDIQNYDAAADIPVADSFELLDAKYPNSKFIYTTRLLPAWLESSRIHWQRGVENGAQKDPNTLAIIARLYGGVDYDEARFISAYNQHDARVRGYFADRADDLLIFDVADDRDDWDKLCQFLGCERPRVDYPIANRRAGSATWALKSTYRMLRKSPIIRNQVTIPVVRTLQKWFF